jgi:hypothetical protein
LACRAPAGPISHPGRECCSRGSGLPPADASSCSREREVSGTESPTAIGFRPLQKSSLSSAGERVVFYRGQSRPPYGWSFQSIGYLVFISLFILEDGTTLEVERFRFGSHGWNDKVASPHPMRYISYRGSQITDQSIICVDLFQVIFFQFVNLFSS